MPTNPTTNFSSGLTQSFQQTVPKAGLPAGSPSGAANTPSVQSPVAKPPAVPASGTTSAKPAVNPATTPPAAKPTAPSTNPAKPPSTPGFSIPIPEGWKDFGRGVMRTGQDVYNNYVNNMSWTDKIKHYLGDSNNFAQMLGALAPIASPLMRTAGMPLMLGAYSYLKDPNYLKELSNGKFPKMGAAIPTAAAKFAAPPDSAFKLDTPITGSIASSGIKPMPNAMLKAPAKMHQPIPSQPMTRDSYDLATGAGLLSGGYMAARSKGPVGSFVGKALAPALTASELANVPAEMTGGPERSWREVAEEHQKSLNPVLWGKNYVDIVNAPNRSAGDKVLDAGLNTVSNPYLLAKINPLGNLLSAAKGIDELTGASDLAYAASGGRIGTNPADGKTRSVPSSLAIIAGGLPMPPKRRVAPWGK